MSKLQDKKYRTLEELPISLNAEDVADVLGISRAGAYVLLRSEGFPTIRIGKRMIVPKEKFVGWMESQCSRAS